MLQTLKTSHIADAETRLLYYFQNNKVPPEYTIQFPFSVINESHLFTSSLHLPFSNINGLFVYTILTFLAFDRILAFLIFRHVFTPLSYFSFSMINENHFLVPSLCYPFSIIRVSLVYTLKFPIFYEKVIFPSQYVPDSTPIVTDDPHLMTFPKSRSGHPDSSAVLATESDLVLLTSLLS